VTDRPEIAALEQEVERLRSRCAALELQLAGLGNFPPGHYHSPIPSIDEVQRRREAIWNDDASMPLGGIDLNEPCQLELLDAFVRLYQEQPFGDRPGNGLRYGFDNVWFCHADAIALYCMMRHLRPVRIMEVGSGHSSAVMLDTDDRFLGGSIAFTFIEPHPERLFSLLHHDDAARHRIVRAPLQDVSVASFGDLQANDILFIDSSHVSKVGSDVNYLFFEILPSLRPGVVVHLHDIVFPFEYPREWVLEGRAWNEAYVLRAFLQYNRAFSIEWFGSFMIRRHRHRFADQMPLCLQNPGGSIWLRKTGV
jgi:hypothetical protein